MFTIDNSNTSSFVALDGHPHPDMPPIHIDIAGVTTLLHNLDSHKAPGPDGIPSKFLKETATSIAPALTLIFKASLKQGKLPSEWKRPLVPIFKKGS